MKILHTVQLYYPGIGGSEEVVKQLSERLVKRGHEVTVATAFDKNRNNKNINGVHIKEFNISGNQVYGIQGEADAYQQFLLKSEKDVMMNYGIQIWSTDLVFPLLNQIKAKKFLVPLGFPNVNDPLYKEYYQKMPLHLKAYNKAIYLSQEYQDKKFADQHGVTNSVVIPNAANEDEFLSPSIDFRKKYGIKTPYMILSVSNHYHLKGHNFVIEAFKKLNRKDVTLVLIGGKPANFHRFNIGGCYYFCMAKSWLTPHFKMVDKISRADTVAAFKAADIFVFGSQFECSPLVIFETMAAKVPFISTDCGNVKDFAAYGKIVQTPDQMAEETGKLLEDKTSRLDLGKKAYENWEKHYTWEKITDQYENLYQKSLNG